MGQVKKKLIFFAAFFLHLIFFQGLEGFCFEGLCFEFDFYHYQTKHFWNKNGKKKPAFNHFKENALTLWTSYVPISGEMISGYVEYDFIDETLEGKTYGFADFEVVWTHCLGSCCQGTFFTQVLGVIPAGGETHALRYGCFGIEGDLLYLSSFNLKNHFVEFCVRGGYRAYQGFPSDQLRFDFGFVYQIYSFWFIRGDSRLEYGLFNGKRKEHFNQIAFNPNFRLLSIELELVLQPRSWISFNAGFFEHLWGENVGTGGGFSVGATATF